MGVGFESYEQKAQSKLNISGKLFENYGSFILIYYFVNIVETNLNFVLFFFLVKSH